MTFIAITGAGNDVRGRAIEPPLDDEKNLLLCIQ
jgi:hypothetical protein